MGNALRILFATAAVVIMIATIAMDSSCGLHITVDGRPHVIKIGNGK